VNITGLCARSRAIVAIAGLCSAGVVTACGGGGGGAGTPAPVAASPIALDTASAVWLDVNTMVWPGTDPSSGYRLFHAAHAGLAATTGSVTGADNPNGDPLTVGHLTATQQLLFPQYAAATALIVPATTAAQVTSLLTGQLAVIRYANGSPANGTQLQTAPVLDSLYAARATAMALGLSFDPGSDAPTFRLWAPTARAVKLNVYANATATAAAIVDMSLEPGSGIWSYTAPDARWTNSAYYLYEVEVYTRAATTPTSNYGAVVTNTVTDPYSLSLNANGQRSMVVNLGDAVTRPAGWPGPLIPTAASPTDSVIYELHVRDFSTNDASVPRAHVGKYAAFADLGSNGMTHLAALAAAGLTHIHLLPVFDFSSVDELGCTTPVIPPSTAAGTEAETAVKQTQDGDCYNWGYDPFHYGAPEGSYSSDPNDGLARVREFRQMVAGLHGIGLRVIMDVVYNHTTASGQAPYSVLDEIVPGYYHRLNGAGSVENHSCCADTATEHAMMEKLMTDTLLTWSRDYKVDAFRFDVMGMIPRAAMTRALAAVEAVDGRGHSYFYGEGFTPDHEVSVVITPASQLNLAGTGIGTFNDRIRDSARGGGPFDIGSTIVARQGFLNGACYDLNAADTADCSGGSADAAFVLQNRISVGLAGNLATFPLATGVTGASVDYFGAPTGYTASPQENIAYVSVHDNETLFDIGEYKHPASTTVTAAARAQAVGLSLVVLSQGIPFVHGADELLRSKSGDSNSYNSGDYFNRIYWDGAANNWAVGLPPDNTGNNATNAASLAPLLASRPVPDQPTTQATSRVFRDFLRIRKGTDLFRLTTAADINRCVSFPDQGSQVHGLIVERILGSGCVPTSSGYRSVVVLYNASRTAQSFAIAGYAGRLEGTGPGGVYLHPVQVGGADATLQSGWAFTSNAGAGTFSVPARTTGVFVEYD
jgi:pullulanase